MPSFSPRGPAAGSGHQRLCLHLTLEAVGLTSAGCIRRWCSVRDRDGVRRRRARLEAAPAATIAAGTAHTSFGAKATLPAGASVPEAEGTGDPLSFDGEGVIDFANGRGRTNLDLTALMAAQGPGQVDGNFETVIDGDIVYVRSPFLASLVAAETPWIKVDPSTIESGTGIDLGELSALGSFESGAHLAFLGGVVKGSVRNLGTETIRATTTTHYRGTVDLRAAVEAAGALVDPERFNRFATALGPELVVDAFLDDGGRLRRLSYDQPLPGGQGGASQRVELEYFDFGAPVNISIPTPDQVTDLSQVLGDR
ncbi:MAG: hypothetical protein ACR2G7_01490 [Acidimicrobiales bacterium]